MTNTHALHTQTCHLYCLVILVSINKYMYVKYTMNSLKASIGRKILKKIKRVSE